MRFGGFRGHLMPFAGWRYWEERAKLTVKAVVAATVAWLVARHLVGHPDPYFAPLAALLGVYPTVVRSVQESLKYGAGFVIGAALAIPVGRLLGPTTIGIAVVLLVAMMVAGWRRLGDQSPQVAFTALFALLFGGHQAAAYVMPRIADVAVGLTVGLAVNALVFPPLHLRRGEDAVREMRGALADAMGALAENVVDPVEWDSLWGERESRLVGVQRQARYAVEQAESSLRANPRARWWGYPVRWRETPGRWAAPGRLNTLENAMSYTRSIGATLRLAMGGDEDDLPADTAFRHGYSALLHKLADLMRHLPEAPDEEAFAEAERMQEELERPHLAPGTDVAGLWDPVKEMLRLSRLLLDQIGGLRRG
ncbi:FUSC family protein [Actinomadura livida]|uniref:Aromatic acid exporter family protein n=1 Tax=Actinomadura livida TaxID=79909 RepID=A0A7W7MZQ1_9ACTN|nr:MULTISPECIES: FUSC family protein [Actinomadura]MBB4777171.1 putative membrane protein YccC [Actinomadura catellatispora]GGU21165.1 FUSC family protein [Actinomadura livida]